jgi:hypothetical protein
MGEAKRRKSKDPDYGNSKAYMSYLELPHTETLVKMGELRQMIKSLRNLAINCDFYSKIIFDHTHRWRKIENLCLFIGMEKLLAHNENLYNTNSIFITKSFQQVDKDRLLSHYNKENQKGFSTAPPPISRNRAEEVLLYSHQQYNSFLTAEDVDIIYQSSNCAAFYIPSDLYTLDGLKYVDFFTKLRLQRK